MYSVTPLVFFFFLTVFFHKASADVTDFSDREVLGNCINGLCPKTYTCTIGVCHRAARKRKTGAPALGPCVNLKCPDNHICETTEDLCYPIE